MKLPLFIYDHINRGHEYHVVKCPHGKPENEPTRRDKFGRPLDRQLCHAKLGVPIKALIAQGLAGNRNVEVECPDCGGKVYIPVAYTRGRTSGRPAIR